MADKRIDQLPAATAINSSDFIHISQGGIDKRISADVLIAALNGGNPFNVNILEESTTARTLLLSDKSGYIRFTNAAAIALTVPHTDDIPWTLGDSIVLRRAGDGVVTVAGAAGVTVNPAASGLDLPDAGQTGQLIYAGNNTWDFIKNGS